MNDTAALTVETLFSAPGGASAGNDPAGGSARRLLAELPELVERTFPLPGKFRAGLAGDVAELSRLLTAARGERQLSWLSRPSALSAYLRYFLPWNVYRLSRLLPALETGLEEGGVAVDLGSGPLVLPLALWLARPDLREKRLLFCCADTGGQALDAGKKLFAALSGGAGKNWEIRTLRMDIHALHPVRPEGQGGVLVAALYVFNEIAGKTVYRGGEALARFAEREAWFLSRLAPSKILLVEPGTPQGGALVSSFRAALSARGFFPEKPCGHDRPCPWPGGKWKWCHFSFDTEDAPPKLKTLSRAAGIPKERAALSFLLAGQAKDAVPGPPGAAVSVSGAPGAGKGGARQYRVVRILSDCFPAGDGLGGRAFGRYGCGGDGAVLVLGTRRQMDALSSGDLVRLPLPEEERRDRKSGALLIRLPAQETAPSPS